MKQLAPLALAGMMLVSCSGSKTVLPYFEDIQSAQSVDLSDLPYLALIQPDDELFISVNSENPRATAAYNLPLVNPVSATASDVSVTPRSVNYRVDSNGDINFPVIGRIHVSDMTVEGLREFLVGRISADVKNPEVTVALANFNVVVAGEVRTPKRISVSDNRLSILDALAEAGDMTEYGERSNVLLIRENNGKRTAVHLDLNNSDVLNSPYYYLQPNDYIYVSPNSIRQANSKYNQNNAFKLSVISTIVSAASVIASLVIALTVK